jgi:HD-GYP domain-containing protein (c-di-GMP phosphodiesterase class II)
MHERTAGMGYPRQVPGSLIHPLAKIAGLADTYVALVSKRPYRPAMLPYLAMETILDLAKLGYFDRETVRLLLVTLSLYPLGSYVRLNDGRVAKVMRTGGEQYAQPVVQIWEKRGASSFEPSEMIDLRFGGGLAVAEAIETFHQAA